MSTPREAAPDGGPYRRYIPEAERPIRRHLPLLLRLRVLLERRRTQASLLVAAVLVFPLWTSAARVDWPLVGFDGLTDRYPGEVVHMEPLTSDKKTSYRVRFVYEHAGEVHGGTSIAGNHQLREGYRIWVDVPRDHDDFATIVGLRGEAVGHELYFGIIAVEAIVLGYAFATMLGRRRVLRLLVRGRLVTGERTNVTRGWWYTTRDPVWDVHVVYEDASGGVHKVTQSTLRQDSVEAGAAEIVAYDAAAPARAVVVPYLPGAPYVVGDAWSFEASAFRLVLALGPPLVFVAANVVGAIVASC